MIVKICGVTNVADAATAAEAGADWLGVVFWPGSRRRVDAERARDIVDAAGGVPVAGVFVDATADEIRRACAIAHLSMVQLHGRESPEFMAGLGAPAMKAVRLRTAEDVEAARRYGGEFILAEAGGEDGPGGTGVPGDRTRAAELARDRPVILAGGLTPETVAAAIREVRPAGVDVASGVEGEAGAKDAEKVRKFLREAKTAFAVQRPASAGP